MKKFIDDFSVLAIEQGLIEKLRTLFSPQSVYGLTNVNISHLVGEREEVVVERDQCTEKLSTLEAGLSELKQLGSHHSLALGKVQCTIILPKTF